MPIWRDSPRNIPRVARLTSVPGIHLQTSSVRNFARAARPPLGDVDVVDLPSLSFSLSLDALAITARSRTRVRDIDLRGIILIQFSPGTTHSRVFHFLIPSYDLHKAHPGPVCAPRISSSSLTHDRLRQLREPTTEASQNSDKLNTLRHWRENWPYLHCRPTWMALIRSWRNKVSETYINQSELCAIRLSNSILDARRYVRAVL